MIVFFRATLLLSKRLHCSGKGMLLASAGRTSTDRTIALSALWEAFIIKLEGIHCIHPKQTVITWK